MCQVSGQSSGDKIFKVIDIALNGWKGRSLTR